MAILTGGMNVLADKAIKSFKVNKKSIQALRQESNFSDALNPIIGYAKAAEIAKKSYKEGRSVIDVAAEETDIPLSRLKRLLDPKKLTSGGIK